KKNSPTVANLSYAGGSNKRKRREDSEKQVSLSRTKLFDRLASNRSTHDVAAACCLARAEPGVLHRAERQRAEGKCGFDSRWVLWRPCPTTEAYKLLLNWESARLLTWKLRVRFLQVSRSLP